MSAKRRKFRLSFAAGAVLLLAIAVVMISIFSNLTGARVDLTSDRLFTMSPSAKKILGELKVPVRVEYYVTPQDKMPTDLKNLERDVTDKLHDFERVSDGKLEYVISNPQNDEELQNELAAKGIRPFQVQSVERDEIGVKLVWSALTIVYKEYPEEIIPQVLPQSLANLEYELISRVYRLTHEEKQKVALMATKRQVDQQLAMMYLQQGMQPPEPQDVHQSFVQLLTEQNYDVAPVELTQESPLPTDADILVVLDPQNLNERQVFEINRALSNGLPTVIAMQSHIYDYSPARQGGFTFTARGQQTGLQNLLATVGVKLVEDHFFDMSLQVLEVPRTQNMGGLRFQTREPVRSPLQILVTESQMNSESALTNRIGSLLYLWGTPLELNESEIARQQLSITTLMTSSDRCWAEDFSDGVLPGSYLNPNNKDFLGPQPLAVMLEGEFPDSFQGQEVPSWPAAAPAAEEEAADAEESADEDPITPLTPAPTQLVLFGSSKMFEDDILGGGQNALLLLNTIDALTHGEDLVSIRTKMLTQRVLKPISDRQKFMWRLIVVGLVPVGLAIFGIARAAMRRKEAALYKQQLGFKSKAQA